MERLYFFFDLEYERVVHSPDLPFRQLLVSVGYVGLHWHPQVELLLVLKGEVTVRNSRRHVSLGPGDLMLINPNELHGLVEQNENLILVLQIDPEVFLAGSTSSGPREYDLAPGSQVPEQVKRRLQREIARLATEKWEAGPGHEFFCISALNDIVGTVVRHIPSDLTLEPVTNAMRRRDLQAKRALEYLNLNHARKVTLDEVAETIGVSRYRASHLIREATGRSMQENLNLIRTGHAVNLLMRTDNHLIDIAMESGFSDPKYFNQYFNRIFGMTPSQMRQKPDWRHAIQNYFGHDGLAPAIGRELVEAYL
jgi:xylan 1,4-beta-xylosidase